VAHNANRRGGGYHLWRWDGQRWRLAETHTDKLTAGVRAVILTISGQRHLRAEIGSSLDLFIVSHPTVMYPARKFTRGQR
jgi:hypothetical protein